MRWRVGSWLLVASALLGACTDDSASGGATSSAGGADGGSQPVGGSSDGGVGGQNQGGSPFVESCDPFEARTSAPEMWVLPDGFTQNVVDLADSATTTLDLMMYQFTIQAIADALVSAHQRGVVVRVLLDPDQGVNDSVRTKLTNAGIEVRDAPAEFSYAHAKVLVVDGERALVSSGNFNSYSASTERNYAVVDEATDDVADLLAIFEHDWSGAALDLSCTRLVVSPENARARLTQLIGSATTNLDLAVMYLSDYDLRDAVQARAMAGVPVRILLADPGWIDGNAQAAVDLQAMGAEVKFSVDYELHAKLIIADSTVFVGSENLSYTALNSNREVGVLITEEAPSALARQTFELDWANGVLP